MTTTEARVNGPIHRPVQFDLVTGPPQAEKLAIGNFGEHGTGKTNLLATAPDLGVVPLDRKTRYTVLKARQEFGILSQCWFPKDDFIRAENPMRLALMSPEEAMKYYRAHVNRVKDAIWTLADPKHPCRTIGIDSGSQLWDDILFANYGRNQKILPRDRGSANQEMRDLLNSLQGKHFVITHKSREVWKNDKPTDDTDVAGFNDLGYYVNVLVEHKRLKDGTFTLDVRMSQVNAQLHGDGGRSILKGRDITFTQLAAKVFGEDLDWSEYL